MPGHVKKTTGPDEDPLPYLVVTLEMKREHAMKVYDSKKSYWCPDNKGNFIECLLESNDGTKAVVMCGHEVIHLGSKCLPRVAFLWSKMSVGQTFGSEFNSKNTNHNFRTYQMSVKNNF